MSIATQLVRQFFDGIVRETAPKITSICTQPAYFMTSISNGWCISAIIVLYRPLDSLRRSFDRRIHLLYIIMRAL